MPKLKFPANTDIGKAIAIFRRRHGEPTEVRLPAALFNKMGSPSTLMGLKCSQSDGRMVEIGQEEKDGPPRASIGVLD